MQAIGSRARLKGVDFVVACDVTTPFVDAAKVFAPQKGASNAQVNFLTTRLQRLVQVYSDEYGVDVSTIAGAGAAGGLAGGLAALGARLVPGFDLVAEEVLLDELLVETDFIITGEGFMDSESFNGKVVGSMAELAADKNLHISAICGDIHAEVKNRLDSVSLVEKFGREAAMSQPLHCIEHAALQILRDRAAR
ncbi:MAG: glycerate kinase [Actinomycetota bacterium]